MKTNERCPALCQISLPGGLKKVSGGPELAKLGYRRSVVFLRPGAFVLFDDLDAERDAHLDWLFHSWNEIDAARRSITAAGGKARASVRLLTGSLTGITQTGDYLIPVPKDFRTQWHLDAGFARGARVALPGVTADAAVLAVSGSWVYAADVTHLEAAGSKWDFPAPVDALIQAGTITVTGDSGSTVRPIKGQ